MILTNAATSSTPLLWIDRSFNPDSMDANLAPPTVARPNTTGDEEGE